MKNIHPTVLFIVPPGPRRLYRGMVCSFVSKANYIWQPQDFVTLSAHVPAKYDVKLLDCNIEGINFAELMERIRQSNPHAMIVSISSIAYAGDLKFLRDLRNNLPDLKILTLGDILLEQSFWKRVLDCGVDLILNSMDVDLANYIETGITSSQNIVLNKIDYHSEFRQEKDVKPKKVKIGIPRHEAFINRKYRMPFMKSFLYTTVTTQFGCPFRCHYCSCSKIPVVYRNYGEVVQELDLVKKLGVHELFFGDPSFGFPRENARGILEGMINYGYRFSWSCYFNPILGDEDMLRMMHLAGCHTVIVGVEDEDFDMLGARFGRRISKEKMFDLVENCRRFNIRVCGDFIIGLNDDKDALERMTDFAIKLNLDFASFNIYAPLMGSIVRERMIREGKISPEAIGHDTGGTTGREDKGLIELRNRAVRRFYIRPSYLLKRLANLTGFTEFAIQFKEMIGLIKNSLTGRKREIYGR